MPPAPPAALQLAQRLRQLRQQWPDVRLTQEKLAMAFSAEESLAAATVSSWESPRSPKIPPRHRLVAYARFFATTRSIEAEPKLLRLEDFTEDERSTYNQLEAELFSLRNLASGQSNDEEIAVSHSWSFSDIGPVTLICAELPAELTGPVGQPENPNYTELQTYSDLDALIELYGHIRAENPAMDVHIRSASKIEPDDLSSHVVLIGGIAWNEITGRLSELANLPVRQASDPKLITGDIFVTHVEGEDVEFWPKWMDRNDEIRHVGDLLVEDVGLLARLPNPLNSSRTLTICNGIHSPGVYGAVRSLTDPRIRHSNERYISVNLSSTESFAILMSVKIIKNKPITPDFNSPDGILYYWSQPLDQPSLSPEPRK